MAVALGVLLLSAIACSPLKGVSTVQIGMIEFGGRNQAKARFGTLRGQKMWHEFVNEGEVLALDFEAGIDKGELAIQILDPGSQVLWQVDVFPDEPIHDQIKLPVDQSGRYAIVVMGDGAGGSYRLHWGVEE
jgi:hypothetical protein